MNARSNDKQTSSILVVDDSPRWCDKLGSILRDIGYHVFTADDDMSGFQKYLEVKPDLVITGWVMQEWHGHQLVRAIRRIDSSVPIIVLTGRPRQGWPEDDESRYDAFLEKIVEWDTLRKCIEELLRWKLEGQKPEARPMFEDPYRRIVDK